MKFVVKEIHNYILENPKSQLLRLAVCSCAVSELLNIMYVLYSILSFLVNIGHMYGS